MQRRKVIALAVVCVLAAGFWLWYPRSSDRERIVQIIQRARHGVETKNVKEIMEAVSPDYRDGEGLTRSELSRLAAGWARTPDRAEVAIDSYQLNVTGTAATAALEVTLTLGNQGTEKPHLTMRFEKQRQGWRSAWLVKSVDGYPMSRLIDGVE
jgi:hypothetical protein